MANDVSAWYFMGMKTITLILCVLCLAACDSDPSPDAKPGRFRIVLDSVGQPYGPGTDYVLKFWLERESGYDGLVQYVETPPATLLEAWQWSDSSLRQSDIHTMKPNESRTMTIGPADFDGLACTDYGYAQLAGTPPGMISGGHHAQFGYAGTVTRYGPSIQWTISTYNGRMVIVIDGVTVHDAPLP